MKAAAALPAVNEARKTVSKETYYSVKRDPKAAAALLAA